MAKIWYVRVGSNPTNDPPKCEITLKECISIFGKDRIRYLGNICPKFPTNRPDLSKDYSKVVIEVDDRNEIEAIDTKRIGFNQPFPREGFYIINLPINQVDKILREKGFISR